MSYREDYYKFTHSLLPDLCLKSGKLLVYRVMRNQEIFIENLKSIWESMYLEKPQLRNSSPGFQVENVKLNLEHGGIIISIPEAAENGEANFIAAVYDLNDNFRYFTYEIGEDKHGKKVYYLWELDGAGNRFIYGAQSDSVKSAFLAELSMILIYELF
jgi:hypothetical protein